ncbi:hypothetical protein RJ639_011663 [Escallonia herrerae]|uniref:Cytochrome P450 n=1 Tax=Escallonia herrerae TaxID=1293975 RepID=A0AA89ARL2_9ASTE|nr:hypothetical protein RJ639_011663 [Escallonia herrerae]
MKKWEDLTEFKPERIEGPEGTRDGFKFVPFGCERRACPGEGLGMRTINLALGSLLQCFDWERVHNEMIDMTEGTGLSFPKAQPLVTDPPPLQASTEDPDGTIDLQSAFFELIFNILMRMTAGKRY